MKKIILLFLVTSFANSQTIPQLKLKPSGFDPIVVETPGLNASDLFKKSLNWVQETYKNPENVLKAKVENEKIRLNGYASNAFSFKTLGIEYSYDMDYTLEISFKEGKYRYECIVNKFKLSDGRSVYFTTESFFKNTGEPRKIYNTAIPTLEESVNNLSLSFFNYVTGATSKKDSNW